MSFLFKYVQNRKSITNISHVTTKQSNPIRTSVLTEKLETSLDSIDEFSAMYSSDALNSDELFSPVKYPDTLLKQKGVSPVTYPKIVLPNREIVLPTRLDRNTLSPALSVDSSASNMPKAKKIKRISAADDVVENSFVTLTSAVTRHLEKKKYNTL